MAPDGNKKLGKRDGAKDILEYRDEGYVPDAIVNFLALLGWNPGNDLEIMTPEEIVTHFSIDKIHKGGAMLDEKKLLWMNKEHMRKQDPYEQFEKIKSIMHDYDHSLLSRLHPTIIDRINTYGELIGIKDEEFGFFKASPTLDKDKILWKDSGALEATTHLQAIINLLPTINFTSSETVKNSIMPYAELHGKGNVLWPLRMSLSGKEKSVDPFTIIFVLGLSETRQRLEAACQLLSS